MGVLFEEIDSQPSDIGEITLRRRRIPALGDRDIYEVKLGEEFLMSSMFVDAEMALADLGLGALTGDDFAVVVGGLGLGYTADAALRDKRVGELLVVEMLEPVIRWHQQEKVPLGAVFNRDDRCRFVNGSFFDLAVEGGFDPSQPGRQFDAILLDIDHSPSDFLDEGNASFYQPDSLRLMSRQLKPGGIFAVWSNEPPADAFMADLGAVFTDVEAKVVSFFNPFQNGESSNTVYLARQPA
ncbi:spermidine synthase [Marinobacter sp. R17]|uniref:spermidine synthase n=1 Tax=Marinobacter sp. R17 TaxID=2484250 RepID=UPI000F4B510D|nr:spermidine synthase [Marinobacter sp. R17]ROT99756.1 spermidine synthase [Marinobacter sp. R17]